MKKKELGKLGEKIAEGYLKKKGYKILEKNYIPKRIRPFPGEIDIVAEKKNTIVFVEVKVSSSFIKGEEKINSEKIKKIKKTAEFFLIEKKLLDCCWEIDIISIEVFEKRKKAKVYHLKNISC